MLKIIKLIIVTTALMLVSFYVSAESEVSNLIDKANYALVATFKVKEGKADRFIEAMKKNTIESRKEIGVIDYRSYQSAKDENVFINFEAYVDKAAFEDHLQSPHVKDITPILDEILSAPIKVEFLINY